MLEYIQFYTKNLSNFTILLIIGVVIAILDITIRNVIKGVYLNVRENMRRRDGVDGREGGDGREGMENKNKKKDSKSADDDGGSSSSEGACPKDCTAVEALRKKLTGLIENASKLQKDIQDNNETIKKQHKAIENMKISIQKMNKK
jgi:hypothetical protein